MKLSKIMIAVAAVAATAPAFAKPDANRIAVSAGASAIRGNLASALGSACTTAGGVMTTFNSGNQGTFVCAVAGGLTTGASGSYNLNANSTFRNFSGTSYAEVRINTVDGSFTAIQQSNGVNFAYFDPVGNAVTTTLPSDSSGTAVKVGGVLDVEPTQFPSTTIGSNVIPSYTALGVGQAFGVAASKALYDAMFASQKLATGSGGSIPAIIPAACNLTDTAKPECVPVIGKAQMSSIMSAAAGNAPKIKGANFLASTVGAGTELVYARRVDTSGTQAAAQNYFLGLPCSKAEVAVIAQPVLVPFLNEDGDPVPADSLAGFAIPAYKTNNLVVTGAGSTGNVITELNKAASYTVGVMSGENNTGSTWRWLRVSGAPMGENSAAGVAGLTNRSGVESGAYDFYFEAVYAGGSVAGDAFWSAISTSLNTLPAGGVGLISNSSLNTNYSKGGLTCQNSASK